MKIRPMTLRGRRDGFAMPLALLTLVVLTVGVAASFSRVTSEMRRTQDRQAETDAFVYAQGALEQFAIDRRNLGFPVNPPAAVESVRIAFVDGYADVISRRVRPKTATEQAIYLLNARAVKQTGNAAWAPQSETTVTQYAVFREGTMNVLSAWTSLSGLQKNGGAGTIDGSDAAPSGSVTDFGSACGGEPTVAGVAVPDVPGYTQSGGSTVPYGSPPVDSLGTQAQTIAAVGIDWDAIVNGNVIIPDLTIPVPDSWPTSWPTGWWPVIRVDGDFTVNPPGGQGTLIVTGNLEIDGSAEWDGIILVGGTLYSNGNNNIHGAVVSGLNVMLGMTVAQSDIGNGNKTYQYDSCSIANAANRFAALVLINKTWSNNWPIW
ncbi:MAG TPA: hypothetical protein VMM79_19085 [Longimicrobiales bacterium]|nr:hypothetical protein [Longimicrobiales bacterium]